MAIIKQTDIKSVGVWKKNLFIAGESLDQYNHFGDSFVIYY